MKKINRIRFSEKVDLLTESEMKSLTGGRANDCNDGCSGTCSCDNGGSGSCRTTTFHDTGETRCTCGCIYIG